MTRLRSCSLMSCLAVTYRTTIEMFSRPVGYLVPSTLMVNVQEPISWTISCVTAVAVSFIMSFWMSWHVYVAFCGIVLKASIKVLSFWRDFPPLAGAGTCILHNYLQRTDNTSHALNCQYCTDGFTDSYDDSRNLVAGRQRNDGNGLDSVTRTSDNRSSGEAASVRDRLAEYFHVTRWWSGMAVEPRQQCWT